MERLIPKGGIEPDTLQFKVYRALSQYLANCGFDDVLCGSTATHIMSMMQSAIDADDLSTIIECVREDAIRYNEWIEKYHPSFKKHFVLEIEDGFQDGSM